MAVDGGGWQDRDSIEGATNTSQKCLAMGPPWYMSHPQSGRLMFLELSYEFAEDFEKCWEEFKREYTDRKPAEWGEAKPKAGVTGNKEKEPQEPTAKSKPKAKAKPKVEATDNEEEEPQETARKHLRGRRDAAVAVGNTAFADDPV